MSWRDKAACKGLTALFFPEDHGNAVHPKAVCEECPVQAECLQYAQDRNEQYGIWGGMSIEDRRRARRGLPTRKNIPHGTHNGYAAHRRWKELACPACLAAERRYQNAHKAKKRLEAGIPEQKPATGRTVLAKTDVTALFNLLRQGLEDKAS